MAKVVDVNELIAQLGSSKSEKRSSAATKLRKQKNVEAGPALLAALKEELKDWRPWKPPYEMLLAIGELGYTEALPYLWELTTFETENTIIYGALGEAIVRLSAANQEDVSSSLRLIETNNYSMIRGGFRAVYVLRSRPSDLEIDRILEAAEDPAAVPEVAGHPNDPVGNRLWIALAAAGWPPAKVKPFLERCLAIPDKGLQLAASNSLKGKYTKW